MDTPQDTERAVHYYGDKGIAVKVDRDWATDYEMHDLGFPIFTTDSGVEVDVRSEFTLRVESETGEVCVRDPDEEQNGIKTYWLPAGFRENRVEVHDILHEDYNSD